MQDSEVFGGYIDAIEKLARAAASSMPTPNAQFFESSQEAIAQLVAIRNLVSYLLSAAGFAAQAADAGRLVGSPRAHRYFSGHLGLTANAARAVVARGERLFGEVPEGERPLQARARELCRSVDVEKQDLVFKESARVCPEASTSNLEIAAEALVGAAGKSKKELSDSIRERVAEANGPIDAGRRRRNAKRRRFLNIGAPDADGGCRLAGYLPADDEAVIQSSLRTTANALLNGVENDPRSTAQLAVDALAQTCRCGSGAGSGAAIVVSMTPNDLRELSAVNDPDSAQQAHARRFPTNTSTELTWQEIVKIGNAGTDYFMVTDERSGVPLRLGRASRRPSLEQKVALAASYLVCAWDGCAMPAIYCDYHHVQAWSQGGRTDAANLVPVCKEHHAANNHATDSRGNYLAHAPGGGPVGVVPPMGETSDMVFNTSTRASKGPAGKARANYGRSNGQSSQFVA